MVPGRSTGPAGPGPVRYVGPVVNGHPGGEGEPASWWATHRRGTGDRPRPGTRLRLRDGRSGTVTAYEGCWKSFTFPVLIDSTGQSLMVTASDVTELMSGGKATRASGATRFAG